MKDAWEALCSEETRAARIWRAKENMGLVDAGFEPASGGNLWKKDGVYFGRGAALQHVYRERDPKKP